MHLNHLAVGSDSACRSLWGTSSLAMLMVLFEQHTLRARLKFCRDSSAHLTLPSPFFVKGNLILYKTFSVDSLSQDPRKRSLREGWALQMGFFS